jgi:hypothetical protein
METKRTQTQKEAIKANTRAKQIAKSAATIDHVTKKPAKGARGANGDFDYKEVNRGASNQLKGAFYKLDVCLKVAKDEFKEGTDWRKLCAHQGIAIDFICEQNLRAFAPAVFKMWRKIEVADCYEHYVLKPDHRVTEIKDKETGEIRLVGAVQVDRVYFKIEAIKAGILAARREQLRLKKIKAKEVAAAKKEAERVAKEAEKVAKLRAELEKLEKSAAA